MRYLYHETTEEERREINKSLICDSELRERFRELLAIQRQMDDVLLEPSSATVLNILSHARSKDKLAK
jgi:hypothetical protein